MTGRAAAIVPRLLTRPQAAAYCGLSISVFSAKCPVRALALGEDRRLERYDVKSLDEWIDRMQSEAPMPSQHWLDRV